MSDTGTIQAIYIGSTRGEPLYAVSEVRAVVGLGLEGDRYFLGRGSLSRWPGPGRQVTLIEAEVLEAVRRDHGFDLSRGRSRRNIVTAGVVLSNRQGHRFRIGEAMFRGVIACQPCGYLGRKTQKGVLVALRGRGGLRAEVLQGGLIRVGDPIEFL